MSEIQTINIYPPEEMHIVVENTKSTNITVTGGNTNVNIIASQSEPINPQIGLIWIQLP